MAPPRKLSLRQTEILAEFAESHQRITFGRPSSVQNLKAARRAWESVAVRLNAVGIKKSPAKWRRYWIEYKAKLKAKAADSRRATSNQGGRLVPLTDRDQRLLDLINRVEVERLPDSNVSDIQHSPIHQEAYSPESQSNSLEVEWLDYDSESDEKIGKEDTNGFVSEESVEEAEDDIAGHLGKEWKNLGGSYTRQSNNETGISRKKVKGPSRNSEQNNMISTSSLSQDPDMLFFHSILPEMKQMNPDQKRQFKMGVWSLASQILQPNTIGSPSDHDYGLDQR